MASRGGTQDPRRGTSHAAFLAHMASQPATILLADDDLMIRRAIQDVLTDMGFSVRQACDGDEACALVDEINDVLPELLITDVDMPGCCGEELATYARQRFGGIKLLFTSGIPQPSLQRNIASDANACFLEKPFF